MNLPASIINGHLRYLNKPMMGGIPSLKLIRSIVSVYSSLVFRASRQMSFAPDILEAHDKSVDIVWCSMQAKRSDAVILYLHGGGFSLGGLDSHGAMVAQLAGQAGIRAAYVDYRLAPESPFPAALDDTQIAYEALLARGFSPDKIVLAGDSAGGCLVFSLLHRIKAAGLPQPKACVTLSPLTDFTMSGESWSNNVASDTMLPIAWLKRCGDAYLNGHNADDPMVSPLLGEFEKPPATYIAYVEDEILASDSIALAAKLRVAGGEVSLHVETNVPHVWPLFQGKFSKADKTIQEMAQFIREQLTE